MSELHTCDVCRLLDHDFTKKPCEYCGLCDAYLCSKDIRAWGRRFLAAVERRREPDYAGMPDYVEKAKNLMIEELKKQNLELKMAS